MSARVPLVTAGAGCGGTGRELSRFGDLTDLDALLIGPVGEPSSAGDPAAGAGRAGDHSAGVGRAGDSAGAGRAVSRPPVLLASPSGLVHTPARPLSVAALVEDVLPWCRARGLPVVCAVRGGTTGAVVSVLQQLRRSLDFTTVTGVEIDLTTEREHTRPALGGLTSPEPPGPWSEDPQACLKLLAAAREQLPRDVVLTAKLGGECPDLLAAARAAVGGGARALVLSGGVPAALTPGDPGPSHLTTGWIAGPAVGPIALERIARVRAAVAAGRVPDVPLIAVGGVHDPATAHRALQAGASGVQLGSALLADPERLWVVHRALRARDHAPPPPREEHA